MDERGWERIAAATGLVFVVLAIVAAFLPGRPLDASASTDQIREWFTSKRTSLLWQAYLLAIALVFFLWFIGELREYLGRAPGSAGRLAAVSFGGGLVAAAMAGVGSLISVSLTYRLAAEAAPILLRYVFDFGNIVYAVAVPFPFAVFAGAAALVILRSGVLPKALGWLGALAAAGNLVSTIALFSSSGPWQPGGYFPAFVPFLLTMLWVAATSGAILARLRRV